MQRRDNKMDFFEKFDEARWEFTYGADENPDLNVLQVGLVAVFFLSKSYLPERRAAIADILRLFVKSYGDKLLWGTYGEPVRKRSYSSKTFETFLKWFEDSAPDDVLEGTWSSSPDFDYVGDYEIKLYSPRDWKEELRNSLGYLRIYLPVEVLKGKGGEAYEALLLQCCERLSPFHGYAGLGLQQCYEQHRYQHLERELAEQFTGLEVGHPMYYQGLRDGFKSVNWYTILSDTWLNKLGGIARLGLHLNDPAFKVLRYPGGAMIRAGEWPELGWKDRDGLPAAYVELNRLLKPVRAPKIGSLGFGSINGEVRFDTASSNEWLRRFDQPNQDESDDNPSSSSGSPSLNLQPRTATPTVLRVKAGEPCPKDGMWYCHEWGNKYLRIRAGEVMPAPDTLWSEQPKIIFWTLTDESSTA